MNKMIDIRNVLDNKTQFIAVIICTDDAIDW
jgi:hypothetical protein